MNKPFPSPRNQDDCPPSGNCPSGLFRPERTQACGRQCIRSACVERDDELIQALRRDFQYTPLQDSALGETA